MKLTYKSIQKGVEDRLKEMQRRAGLMDGFLNRVVYPAYQNAQAGRWLSENSTEGTPWKSLDPKYQEYKLKKYAKFPGSGHQMLIATQKLFESVVGKSRKNHRKIVKRGSLRVYTTLPYAKYVDKERDFTEFGQAFYDNIKRRWMRYVKTGVM
jgi:hypothetical protein